MTLEQGVPVAGSGETGFAADIGGGLGGLEVTFDHAAVAVPRIRDVLPLYRDVLGGAFLRGGDNVRVGYRGLQLRFAGGTRMEIIEPLAGSTFLDSFLRRTGGGGLHHITFKLADVEAAADRLRAHGYPLTGLHLENPSYREVFVHPRDSFGTLVQLVEEPVVGPSEVGTIDELLAAGEGIGVPGL
ncbi:VOC family protein [Streptosporangium sp. NPDC002544]|uniref:VOC family protein n=1 Tax=Streptosporangium sp. NPDC002544 TaxID=3154538 RepID=UPI0033295920